MFKKRARAIYRAVLETLESRQLLSTVVLTGTTGNDPFTEAFDSGAQTYTFGGGTGGPVTVPAAGFTGFTVVGNGGSDTLAIGGGTPTLLNDGGTGLAVTVASGASLNFAVSQHLASLTVNSSGTAKLPVSGRQILVTSALNLAGSTDNWTGSLDLGNGYLIVHGGNLPTLTNQIKSGFNNGQWNGTGIESASAATDSTHLTAVGVLANNTGGSTPIYPSFDGETAVSTDALAEVTYYGDANLDGQVDGSDYSKIDYGYLAHLTGWANGDFNYDGVVDGSDYTLIDNAFNTQGPNLNQAPQLPSVALFGGSSSDTPGGTATGSNGGDPTAASFSGNVRYSDGSVTLSSSDIAGTESGIISGVTRSWTSEAGLATGGIVGNNTVVTQLPSLVQEPSGALLAISGTSTKYFDANGSGYTEHYFGDDTLAADGSGGYLLTDSVGNQFHYYGFGTGIAASQQGQLQTLTDPAGNVTSFTYSGGQLQQINRTRLSDSAILEQDIYSYNGSKLASVQVNRRVNGALTPIQTASYTYYDGSNSFGRAGDLELVTVTEGGTAVNYKLYRYDPTSGLLLYAVEGDAYERLAANVGSPLTASNATIAPYANEAFTYYTSGANQGRVATQSLNGGTYTYSYNYFGDTGATALNTWRYKTVETLPDGNTNTVYTNTAGEVLLKVFNDVSDSGNPALAGQQWATAYQYDAQGRLLLTANPSSVTASSSGGQLFLSDPSGTPTSWYLNSTGLENLTDYYTSGASAGYQDDTYLRQGYSGSEIEQSTETYTAYTALSGIAVDPVASDTVYRNNDGSGQETTSYTYSNWQNVLPLSETITYPIITAAENGPDTADTEMESFDAFGRVISTTDGDGKVTNTAYDDATGAVTSSTQDVGGLNLLTTTTVDGLGRATSTTDPNGYTTQIYYVDTAAVQEVITTPPAVSTGLNAPVQVTRDDRANGNIYTFSVVAGGSALTALSESHTDQTGQTIWSDRYATVSGISYSPPSGASSGGMGTTPGTLSALTGGTQYRTVYGYDSDGRENLVARDIGVTTNLNITPVTVQTLTAPQVIITAYDSLGRAAAVFTGTSNTGYVSPASPGSNLTEITSYQYDNNGVGDGNLTQTTQYPGTGPNRVTQTAYDFRDRATVSEQGVGAATGTHPPVTVTAYDNLDEAITVQVYDGDIASLTSQPATSLRAETQTFYDEQGRVYQTLQHSIDQTAGTDNGSLATNTWYNHRGLVIKTSVPNGLVTKTQYDGAGRVLETSTTDGGGDAAPGAAGGWNDAGNLTGDIVLQQNLNIYDADGNVTFAVTKQRNYSYLGTGELITAVDSATGYDEARISFVGNWYDEDDRLITIVNYGNNGDDGVSFAGSGGAEYARPSAIPVRNNASSGAMAQDGGDTLLRTDYQYDQAGQQAIVIDPRNIKARTYYDALGRTTDVTQAYTGLLSQYNPEMDPQPSQQNDAKVEDTYNGADEKLVETSVTFNAANTSSPKRQHTTYTYGVTKGSDIYVNDNTLLASTQYDLIADDPSANLQPTVGLTADITTITGYTALGDVIQQTDRDGTTHAYQFDALGRQVDDLITGTSSAAGSLISTATDENKTGYDTLGRSVDFQTLKSGTILSEDLRQYDGLGNLIAEYEEHNGAVNTGTSAVVQYTYDTNFTSNYSRIISEQYPYGSTTAGVSYEYGYFVGSNSTLNTLNNAISRIGAEDGAVTPSAAARVEAYDYLGLNTVVNSQYENVYRTTTAKINVGLSDLTSDPGNDLTTSDAGTKDPYAALDRFGRTVEQDWDNLVSDIRIFGYDADSNKLYSFFASTSSSIYTKWKSEIFHAQGATADVAYDDLNRQLNYARGVMGSATSLTVQQTGLAGNPNTLYIQASTNAFTLSPSSGDYIKSTANNEPPIAQGHIYEKPMPTGAVNLGGFIDPSLDRRDIFLTYDAWGNLVTQSAGSPLTASDGNQNDYIYKRTYSNAYRYDALGRRITETTTAVNGSMNTDQLYYDSSGNVVSESSAPQEGATRYVYSAARTGMMVLREDATFGRVWVFQAADGSVIDLYQDKSGGSADVEHVLYTPQGLATFEDPSTSSTAGYNFADQSEFAFRYLWHGGREELDEDIGIYSSKTVTYRQSGLIYVNGAEYDATTGQRLLPDLYAYYRPGLTAANGTPAPNGTANEYSARGAVNSSFPLSGTIPTWQDDYNNALGQDAVVQGIGALADPLEYGLNFAGAFIGQFTTRALGILQAVGGAAEIAVGAGLDLTGYGALLGIGLGLNGADNIAAGVHSAYTGNPTQTITEEGISNAAQYLGASQAVGNFIGGLGNAAVGLGGTFIAGGITSSVAVASEIAAKGEGLETAGAELKILGNGSSSFSSQGDSLKLVDAENFAQTGSGSFTGPADDAYAAIRNSTTDVQSIADNTGISEANIQNVKNHLFVNEHLLDRYVAQGVPAVMGRFDSDISIAQAWFRLESGAFTQEDILLLKHETAESWYVQKYGPSYNAAHEAAQARFPAPQL
jgi:YD repeat-containing protein